MTGHTPLILDGVDAEQRARGAEREQLAGRPAVARHDPLTAGQP
jgi:hypothetical protein